MFRQLKGRAYQEVKEREANQADPEVIPFVGGTIKSHEALRHPLPAPCRAYELDYEKELEQSTFGDLSEY